MKYLVIRVTVALVAFVLGVYVTAQVNRAARCVWPDIDVQHRNFYGYSPENRRPCVLIQSRIQSLSTR